MVSELLKTKKNDDNRGMTIVPATLRRRDDGVATKLHVIEQRARVAERAPAGRDARRRRQSWSRDFVNEKLAETDWESGKMTVSAHCGSTSTSSTARTATRGPVQVRKTATVADRQLLKSSMWRGRCHLEREREAKIVNESKVRHGCKSQRDSAKW